MLSPCYNCFRIRLEVIGIGTPLSTTEIQKANQFLSRIKPLLATNDCVFMTSQKNKDFDRLFSMKHNQKIDVLKSLTANDCVKIEPNNNSRFEQSEVYVFLKCVEILVYGESQSHKLYIKIYIRERSDYDTVIAISFHEEGLYD